MKKHKTSAYDPTKRVARKEKKIETGETTPNRAYDPTSRPSLYESYKRYMKRKYSWR